MQLTTPVEGTFPRGNTLAFRDEAFHFQMSIKRRDDRLNHLYRACVDYRMSASVEDPRAILMAGPCCYRAPDGRLAWMGTLRGPFEIHGGGYAATVVGGRWQREVRRAR